MNAGIKERKGKRNEIREIQIECLQTTGYNTKERSATAPLTIGFDEFPLIIPAPSKVSDSISGRLMNYYPVQ
jgi:hypothetical protein